MTVTIFVVGFERIRGDESMGQSAKIHDIPDCEATCERQRFGKEYLRVESSTSSRCSGAKRGRTVDESQAIYSDEGEHR